MSDLKPVATVDELRTRLGRFSRLSLADLPTPLLDCPRLSEALEGPRILVKREDQTGMAFGGNKVREFEYSVAPAVEEGYDVLLHGAASQSNQSRLTAALAARLGLKSVMVGRKDAQSEPVNGNLLLAHLFGAEVHLVEGPEEKEAVLAGVRRHLGLSGGQTSELVELAESETEGSVCLYEFTRLIHESFDNVGKGRLIEELWRVAFADRVLEAQEEFLIRKIARLLHLPHGDFIAAKQRARVRVQERAGQ